MEHVTEIFKEYSLLYAMRLCFLMLNCSAEAESAVFGNTLMTAERLQMGKTTCVCLNCMGACRGLRSTCDFANTVVLIFFCHAPPQRMEMFSRHPKLKYC